MTIEITKSEKPSHFLVTVTDKDGNEATIELGAMQMRHYAQKMERMAKMAMIAHDRDVG